MSNRITLDQLPKRYQDQVAQEIARHPSRKPAKLQPIPEAPPASQKPATAVSAGKARLRQDRTGPNKWEREFEIWLRAQFPDATVISQALRLRLGNGAWYKTDMIVVQRGADSLTAVADTGWWTNIRAFEVKGFRRQAGILAVKVAASQYPWITFHLATKRTKNQGGGWAIERVLP